MCFVTVIVLAHRNHPASHVLYKLLFLTTGKGHLRVWFKFHCIFTVGDLCIVSITCQDAELCSWVVRRSLWSCLQIWYCCACTICFCYLFVITCIGVVENTLVFLNSISYQNNYVSIGGFLVSWTEKKVQSLISSDHPLEKDEAEK